MHSIARVAISMILVTSAFAAYKTSAKLRRDGVLNLYPFPRVGRAHHTWEVPLNDFYLEYKPLEKRQLYAFPRVGRSENSEIREHPSLSRLEDLFRRHQSEKREGENGDSTGMWFGPRLGRAYKSEEDTYQANEHSEPEQVDTEFTERKKRQTNH